MAEAAGEAGWVICEVPPGLKNTWRKEGLVKRRDMKEDR
jgi:hypothetical protein